MLVFTIINEITDQVYVASTNKSAEERWREFKNATLLGLKADFYDEIREHGANNFTIADFGVGMDREHVRELIDDAIDRYDAISLQGLKTKITDKPAPASKAKTNAGTSKTASKSTSKASTAKKAPAKKPTAVDKLATGRTGSSTKEKRIRESIAKEKAAREAAQQASIAAQKDEMAEIMARIDSRATTAYRRGR